jgi:hypothetical protein
MKIKLLSIIPLIIILFLFACQSNTDGDTLTSDSLTDTRLGVIEKVERSSARPSAKVTASDLSRAYCEERDSAVSETKDPIIIKKCVYKSYMIIQQGQPDYSGRYSWDHMVFLKTSAGFKKIDNQNMFKNRKELLAIINRQLRADYESLQSDPESAGCWKGMGKFEDIKRLNDLQLGLSEDAASMQFNYSLGMGGACFSQDLLLSSVKLTELDKYLAR